MAFHIGLSSEEENLQGTFSDLRKAERGEGGNESDGGGDGFEEEFAHRECGWR